MRLALAIVFTVCASAEAQVLRSPRIGYVYPAGGQQGTTFEVRVGGQYLDGAAAAYVSGGGVQATVLEHIKPISQKEFTALRDQAKELMDRRAAAQGRKKAEKSDKPDAKPVAWTAEDEKKLEDIRKRMALFVRKPAAPAIVEVVRLQVTIAADAPVTQRELRLGANLGLTNPLAFEVGQLPEVRESAEAKPEQAKKYVAKGKGGEQRPAANASETVVRIPAVVNGQIMPGDVDRFRFTAKKGQKLVAVAQARSLIPYIPDAVPGWFQATLAIYDGTGRELAYDDDFLFHPDPVLFVTVPEDGQYVVEIKDSIYRGREDFVYRIAVGELPFITSIFPLGGKAGTKTEIELRGWNLSSKELQWDGHAGIDFAGVCSGQRRFPVDDLPEIMETEPNESAAEARPTVLPLIVNGRIDRPGDIDTFRIEGRAGQQVAAEVYARRLDSPVDSTLALVDATGKQIAFNDDHEDKGSGLNTHHADSWLLATLPADGTYYVRLADAQHKGGPEYAYRLRIGPPRPSFELRVAPSSLTLRSGLAGLVDVYALRRDGFDGEITLSLKDAPAGFSLSGGRIPAGQSQIRATVTATVAAQKDLFDLHLQGSAKIDGQTVIRDAVPAEDMMQAFAYRHLVPVSQWKATVAGKAAIRGVGWTGAVPAKIPAGGTAKLSLSMPSWASSRYEIELSDPPEGIALKEVTGGRTSTDILVSCDAKVKPGLQGNLIFIVSNKRTETKDKSKPAAKLRAVPIAVLPAASFDVVK